MIKTYFFNKGNSSFSTKLVENVSDKYIFDYNYGDFIFDYPKTADFVHKFVWQFILEQKQKNFNFYASNLKIKALDYLNLVNVLTCDCVLCEYARIVADVTNTDFEELALDLNVRDFLDNASYNHCYFCPLVQEDGKTCGTFKSLYNIASYNKDITCINAIKSILNINIEDFAHKQGQEDALECISDIISQNCNLYR